MEKYQLLFKRLEPRTTWKGGRITHTDLLTLHEATKEASLHAGTQITTGDFLRAAARGEILLRAIVRTSAKVEKHDGGIFCNYGEPTENIVPQSAIPTLPLEACSQLANTGHASWRTFDGFETEDGFTYRFTIAKLNDSEPDFETVADDCRISGMDVHALADTFIDDIGDTDAAIETGKNPSQVAIKGCTKAEIKAATWPGHVDWDQLLSASTPRWLIDAGARIQKGKPGGASALWNPAHIAVGLSLNRGATIQQLDRVIRDSFPDYLGAWNAAKALL